MIHGREAILAVLPDFDFYNLHRVTSFSWSSRPDTISGRAAADFALIAVYDDTQSRPASAIRVLCSEVKQMRLPEFGTSLFLTEIEIEDTSTHQLEGIRYKLKDFGGSQFEVMCGKIEMTIIDSGNP